MCAYVSGGTYHLGAPQAVLVPEEFVREAQVLCELLQQVDTEAGAAAVEAGVGPGLCDVQPGGMMRSVGFTGLSPAQKWRTL